MTLRTRLAAAALAATVAVTALVQPAAAGDRTGTFAGASGHVTAGTVTVVRTDAGWEVRLGADFDFDGAPDPRIAFGKGGSFAAGTDFEPLKSASGAQVYVVPAEIDPAGLDTVILWCRQFAVPLGVAAIE